MQSILGNVLYYLRAFVYCLGLPNGLANSVGIVILALAIFCAFRGLKVRFNALFALIFFGNLGLLILWPFKEGVRFIFCAFPFLLALSFVGLDTLKARAMGISSFIFSLCILCWGYGIFDCFKDKALREESGSFSPQAREMYDFIAKNTQTSDKIIFINPRVLYLATSRLSFYTGNISRLKEAQYLLINITMPNINDFTLHTLQKQGKITLISENNEFRFYKILF